MSGSAAPGRPRLTVRVRRSSALALTVTRSRTLPSSRRVASNSAILSLDLGGAAVARLQDAGAVFAERAGRSRFACHLYNTPAQVDRVLELITG